LSCRAGSYRPTNGRRTIRPVGTGPTRRDMPPELVQLLEPIIAAAAAGQDVEPLVAGLREQLLEMGGDESQVDGLLEMIRSRLKSPE
jgi:hypothetical protein